MAFGFLPGQWEVLADALRYQAANYDVAKTEATPFGMRYVIEGTLQTPDQRNPKVRTVWFIEVDRDIPRLVTSYPIERDEVEDDTGIE